MSVSLAELHAPYAPLLRYALAQASVGNAALALDIGCGPGLKAAWLAACTRWNGRLIGVDIDRAALHVAHDAHPAFVALAGDALALPLRDGCADLAWCVAAMHLFADQAQALRELRRVLRPAGVLVVAVVEQRWVQVRHWPAELQTVISRRQATDAPASLARGLPPADDLGDDLRVRLERAGFSDVALHAYLLEPSLDPLAAALALADWAALRAALAPLLAADTLRQCDALAAEPIEPDPAHVLLLAAAKA